MTSGSARACSVVAQDFGRAAVQRLAAALEQAVVGGVLDQRVLEAIVGLRRRRPRRTGGRPRRAAPTTLAARLRRGRPTIAQQRVGEVASKNRADLRDLARRAEPIEARGERLLQGRRDRLHAALLAALQQEARHLLDEQRHAAGALAHAFDHFLGERMARRDLADHARDAGAIERGQSEIKLWCERRLQGGRNSGRVVANRSSGACAPRSAKARKRSSDVGSAQCRSSKARTTG